MNKISAFLLKTENIFFELFFNFKLKKFIKDDFLVNKYKYFIDIHEINEWGKNYNEYYQSILNFSNHNLNLIKEQQEEINVLEYYSGYYSIRVNDHLRKVKEDSSLDIFIHKLDNHLNKFILKENIVVIRKISNKFIDNKYKKKFSFIDSAFISTSLNLMHRLDENSTKKLLKNESLIILKIPKGTKGSYIEKALPNQKQKKEYEFLISRNQKIFIEYNSRILSNRLIKAKLVNS
jgi:hypothetical protein